MPADTVPPVTAVAPLARCAAQPDSATRPASPLSLVSASVTRSAVLWITTWLRSKRPRPRTFPAPPHPSR